MRDPIHIAGPTASGKTDLALLIAERLQGEIISVDSMQVYRGLDIGTAKPGPEELRRVPHHLIDVVALGESFDAARFLRLAKQAEADIRARGRCPIYCGGTGLYFKALAAGLGEAPPADPALRETLEEVPTEDLLRELEEKDPVTFAAIDRANRRRVIRAVEVVRLTGRPFSSQRDAWQVAPPAGTWLGLARERADLNERINRRVDRMFAAGLVRETEHLLQQGLEQNQTAMQAIGYRQVVEHLRGERNLPDTIELIKQRTRQYAKRQMTWFRRQLSLTWMAVKPTESAEELLERAIAATAPA